MGKRLWLVIRCGLKCMLSLRMFSNIDVYLGDMEGSWFAMALLSLVLLLYLIRYIV